MLEHFPLRFNPGATVRCLYSGSYAPRSMIFLFFKSEKSKSFSSIISSSSSDYMSFLVADPETMISIWFFDYIKDCFYPFAQNINTF